MRRGHFDRWLDHPERLPESLPSLLPSGEKETPKEVVGSSTTAESSIRAARSGSVALPTAEGESLEWFNALFAQLWPRIDKMVQRIVAESVTPQIKEKLPSLLKSSFCFKNFTLGDVPPKLGPIEFYKKSWGLQLGIGIVLNSEAEIQISCGASLGIKSLKFVGTLTVQLGPLIDESPIIGGLVVYFLDAPELDLHYTGLGNVAQVPGLAGIVKQTIDAAIAGALVFPNVISVPLGTEEQGVDAALLSQPKPMGVMRVTALSAAGLAAMDISLLTKSTSDPYVRIRIADNDWKSSTVAKTCNPVWRADDVHDFVVFDRKQQVLVDVYDEDVLTADDHLGRTRPLLVADLFEYCEMSMPLFDAKTDFRKNQGNVVKLGTVRLKFEWLEFLPGELGPAGCIVVIEVLRLWLPPALGDTALFSARIGSTERRTAAVKAAECVTAEAPPTSSGGGGSRAVLEDVVRRCSENGIDVAMAARLTGLDLTVVEEILRRPRPAAGGSEEAAAAEAAAEVFFEAVEAPAVEFNRVFYIPASAAEMESGELELAAVGGKGGEESLGRTRVALKDVAGCSGATVRIIKLVGDGRREPLCAEIVMSVQGLRSSAYGDVVSPAGG